MDILNYINKKKKRTIQDIISNKIVILTPTKEEFIYIQKKLYNILNKNLYGICHTNTWDIYKERMGIYIGISNEIIIVNYINEKYDEDNIIDIYNIIW